MNAELIVTLILGLVSSAGAVFAAIVSRQNKRELSPNGGLSIKDTVDRIDRDQTKIAHDVTAVRERVARIEGRLE